MPLDIERIPMHRVVLGSTSEDREIKPMSEDEFDRWLDRLDKEEQLNGWWIGHDGERYIVSIPYYKAGSASQPQHHRFRVVCALAMFIGVQGAALR